MGQFQTAQARGAQNDNPKRTALHLGDNNYRTQRIRIINLLGLLMDAQLMNSKQQIMFFSADAKNIWVDQTSGPN